MINFALQMMVFVFKIMDFVLHGADLHHARADVWRRSKIDEFCIKNEELCIKIHEFCRSGGELFSRVVDNGCLGEKDARFYFRQVSFLFKNVEIRF